jgi:hypothetical protein
MNLPPLGYKPGWRFRLGGPGNRFLCVFARTPDSLAPERERITQHMREIPDGMDDREFARWVRDFLLDVERHECCEFLQVDGRRPFFPGHGDDDPYAHTEHW